MHGTLFKNPLLPTENMLVKARTFDPLFSKAGTHLRHTQWSPMTITPVIISPVTSNLRVTEIMYHPPDPPDGDPEAEWIELTNVGSQRINLKLIQLAGGIDFALPDLDVAPRQSIVVVKSEAAFRSQYPDFSGVIAGEYEKSLSNNNENLILRIIEGDSILDFEYDDEWYPSTDGGGASLEIRNPVDTAANLWGEKESWRASKQELGTPGENDLIITGAKDWYIYR